MQSQFPSVFSRHLYLDAGFLDLDFGVVVKGESSLVDLRQRFGINDLLLF